MIASNEIILLVCSSLQEMNLIHSAFGLGYESHLTLYNPSSQTSSVALIMKRGIECLKAETRVRCEVEIHTQPLSSAQSQNSGDQGQMGNTNRGRSTCYSHGMPGNLWHNLSPKRDRKPRFTQFYYP